MADKDPIRQEAEACYMEILNDGAPDLDKIARRMRKVVRSEVNRAFAEEERAQNYPTTPDMEML